MARRGPSLASQLVRSRAGLAAATVLGTVMLAALAAPLISPQNPHDLASLELMDSLRPPAVLWDHCKVS